MTVKFMDGGIAKGSGNGERLIISYTHSGNTEYRISLADWATGILTLTAPHGIASGASIGVAMCPNDWIVADPFINMIYMPEEWIKELGHIKLLYVDATSVKLVKNDGVTAIVVNSALAGNASIDATKFHFEDPIAWSITNMPLTKRLRMRTIGYCYNPYQRNRYVSWKVRLENGTTVSNPGNYLNPVGMTAAASPTAAQNGGVLLEDWVVDVSVPYTLWQRDDTVTMRRPGYATAVYSTTRDNNQRQWFSQSSLTSPIAGITEISAYSVSYAGKTNGTLIQFFDMGGI